jgi:hypothetical protein
MMHENLSLKNNSFWAFSQVLQTVGLAFQTSTAGKLTFLIAALAFIKKSKHLEEYDVLWNVTKKTY